MLHLRCGDDILQKLANAGLPGGRMRWIDPRCLGPLGPFRDDEHRWDVRARFTAERFRVSFDAVRADLVESDRKVREAAAGDEVVLWFEEDLFDHSILVAVLDLMAAAAPAPKAELILVGNVPGGHRFYGLGQLSQSQLASLFPARSPVTDDQFALARRAAAAWQSETPEALEALANDPACAALSGLSDAIRRYLAEYPSTRNGLGLSMDRALMALDAGPRTAGELFAQLQSEEDHPWLGDGMFFAMLGDLAAAPRPLVALAGGVDLPDRTTTVQRTGTGDDVRGGALDWWETGPRVLEHGGVRLSGRPAWRWDGTKIVAG